MSDTKKPLQPKFELEQGSVVGGIEKMVVEDPKVGKSSQNGLYAHTIYRDGVSYAGLHLIVDMWGGKNLGDLQFIEAILSKCAKACGAKLLHIQLHHFSENNGVTGVAVLAESHITLHTWPEFDYAAFDIFLCGSCEPHHAVRVLNEELMPERTEVSEHLRGMVSGQIS